MPSTAKAGVAALLPGEQLRSTARQRRLRHTRRNRQRATQDLRHTQRKGKRHKQAETRRHTHADKERKIEGGKEGERERETRGRWKRRVAARKCAFRLQAVRAVKPLPGRNKKVLGSAPFSAKEGRFGSCCGAPLVALRLTPVTRVPCHWEQRGC